MFKRTFLPCFTLKHLKVSRDRLCLTLCQPRRNIHKTNNRSIKFRSTTLDVGSAVYNFSSWLRLPHKFLLVWLSSKSVFYHLGAGGNFKNWRFNFLLSQYDSILGIHTERNKLQGKKKPPLRSTGYGFGSLLRAVKQSRQSLEEIKVIFFLRRS